MIGSGTISDMITTSRASPRNYIDGNFEKTPVKSTTKFVPIKNKPMQVNSKAMTRANFLGISNWEVKVPLKTPKFRMVTKQASSPRLADIMARRSMFPSNRGGSIYPNSKDTQEMYRNYIQRQLNKITERTSYPLKIQVMHSHQRKPSLPDLKTIKTSSAKDSILRTNNPIESASLSARTARSKSEFIPGAETHLDLSGRPSNEKVSIFSLVKLAGEALGPKNTNQGDGTPKLLNFSNLNLGEKKVDLLQLPQIIHPFQN